MTFKIGFAADSKGSNVSEAIIDNNNQNVAPKKSIVQVYFSVRDMTLSYYNDSFDLHKGDLVYVDGKLEGLRGRVVDVNYNFKIKISDYKRVIAVGDTNVKGEFFMASSHFVTFQKNVLPKNKVLTWFKAPDTEDDFVSSSDSTSFSLDNLSSMKVSPTVAERGQDYYLENRVRYISLDGSHGYAIVEGSKAYEIEFEYHGGEISKLTCGCYCGGYCKHEFATMLQLKETLKIIEKNYAAEYERNGYFAAVNKLTLFEFAVDGKETGNFTL